MGRDLVVVPRAPEALRRVSVARQVSGIYAERSISCQKVSGRTLYI